MSREELQAHIQQNMGSESQDDPPTIDHILCSWCGEPIDTSTAHAVHRVPEHGGEMKEKLFCDPGCLHKFWQDLLDV